MSRKFVLKQRIVVTELCLQVRAGFVPLVCKENWGKDNHKDGGTAAAARPTSERQDDHAHPPESPHGKHSDEPEGKHHCTIPRARTSSSGDHIH